MKFFEVFLLIFKDKLLLFPVDSCYENGKTILKILCFILRVIRNGTLVNLLKAKKKAKTWSIHMKWLFNVHC